MPYTPPTASYATTVNGTYTALTGIQSIFVSRGRRRFQDNFPGSTCVIELIPANSYATPLALGQFIDVRTSNSATAPAFFVGRITDVERRYDIPYNTSTGAAPGDRIRITATGGTGAIAANYLTAYQRGTGAKNAFESITELGSSLTVAVTYVSNATTVPVEDLVFTGGAMDYVNQVCRTGQVVIDDYDYQRATLVTTKTFSDFVFVYEYGEMAPYQTLLPAFTDTGGSGYKFNRIEYLSSVNNAFTKIIVDPNTGASQEATRGNPPYNTLVYATYNTSSTDSFALADYLATVNNQTTPAPFSISSDTTMADTITDLAKILVGKPSVTSLNYVIGLPISVTFRGTTVYATIQGVNTTFTPEKATVQLYLAPSLGQPFTLDSSFAGVLDRNRLGL